MKNIVCLAVSVLILSTAFSCSKGNGDNTTPQTQDVSKDIIPDTSEDPSRDESQDPSKDYAQPQVLVISHAMLSYELGDDGIKYANVSFQIETDAEDIYVVWNDDANLLSDGEIIAKYKPMAVESINETAKMLTIPQRLICFRTYPLKVVAANGDKTISKDRTFDTWNSNVYARETYIEADQASAVAGPGSFTIQLYKDKEAFDAGTGGYSLQVQADASGNRKNGKYVIPDGTYTSGTTIFQTIIPGVGPLKCSLKTNVEVAYSSYRQAWTIAVYLDFGAFQYEDWNEMKVISGQNLTFTFTDGQMPVVENEVQTSAFAMNSNVDFTPAASTVRSSIFTTTQYGMSFQALSWGAESGLKNGFYEFMAVMLVIPNDFVPGISDWSELDGTYTIGKLTEAFSVYTDPIFTLLGAPSYTYWIRMSAPMWDTSGFIDVLSQSCIPTSAQARISASDSGDWLQLELEYPDPNSSYKARCSTVIMTDNINYIPAE